MAELNSVISSVSYLMPHVAGQEPAWDDVDDDNLEDAISSWAAAGYGEEHIAMGVAGYFDIDKSDVAVDLRWLETRERLVFVWLHPDCRVLH